MISVSIEFTENVTGELFLLTPKICNLIFIMAAIFHLPNVTMKIYNDQEPVRLLSSSKTGLQELDYSSA